MTRLRDKNSSAIVAVKNLAAARDFYEQTLGLEVADASMEAQGAVGYRTGGTLLTVYQSEFAGTNKANAATWAAGEDFDAIIADLRNKVFQEYGANRVVETWSDDVPDGKVTDFRRAVKAKDGEDVVFSWIEWSSKEARDEAWPKMMEDERMKPDHHAMPFDGMRMIYGGFAPIVEA